MALAKYFSKNLLAINQLLHSNHDELVRVLSNQVVGILFGKNASSTFEGLATLDLVTRLVARLYPKIKFQNVARDEQVLRNLVELALGINGAIEIIEDGTPADCLLVVGDVAPSEVPTTSEHGIKLFCGSDGWNARISLNGPVPFSQQSTNPFGAGAAGCLVTSFLFRHIFRQYLGELPRSYEIIYSTYDNRLNSSVNPPVGPVQMNDLVIAGLGAIGNGCIWALSRLPCLGGTIALVDKETLAETNLQRYIMKEESHVMQPKVDVLARYFESHQDLLVIPHQKTWSEYVAYRNDSHIHCVAVGIDNWLDRIGIQSTLPKTIFNAYTEPETIGISRHLDFTRFPCLACGYIPIEKQKNYTSEVADNLNIPQFSDVIKDYLNRNQPVDSPLLALISQSNNIPPEALQHFNGMTIPQFYSEFVCGGILLSLTGNSPNSQEMDAPLAFQSALAGILLAAEVVKHMSDMDLASENRTDLYPLQPLGDGNPLNRALQNDSTGRCLCHDQDFKSVYERKWIHS